MCLTLLGLVAGSGAASAQVRDGVLVGPVHPLQPEPTGSWSSIAGGTSINFDEMGAAPCVFSELVPLTIEYAAQGVTFSGVGLNGGARINECGGFGVSGHSVPNFLAFNVDPLAIMANGGFPIGPETITFDAPVNRVTINAGQSQAGVITMECFDEGGNSVGTDSLVALNDLHPLSVSAYGIVRCVLDFTGDLAVFDDLSWDPTPPCFTLDFETEDDFATDLVNGQHINTEFGGLVSVTSSGPNAGAGIFDSTLGGPNDPSQDLDLLVDTGNILILQTENFPPDGNDVFPRPNDDEDGGTLRFAFNSLVVPSSVRLIDMDATDGGATVVLRDNTGKRRTYSVPANWTGDRTQFQPGQGTLDLTVLAPQPGFGSSATAVQDAGFNSSSVIEIAVNLDGSGGVDDLTCCTAAALLPHASAHIRNGAGLNPLTLTSGGLPVIGGTWVTYLDCSGHASGLALLTVRASPVPGSMTPYGELLIGGPRYLRIAGVHPAALLLFTQDVPNDVSLAGFAAYSQGLCTGAPGPQLSNALDIVLGF